MAGVGLGEKKEGQGSPGGRSLERQGRSARADYPELLPRAWTAMALLACSSSQNTQP